jgi:hypothetical protein
MLIRMMIDVSYATGLLRKGITYEMPDAVAEAMVMAVWAAEESQPASVRIIPADEHAADLMRRRTLG